MNRYARIVADRTQFLKTMNGDKLIIDRSGPNGSVNMKVLLADKSRCEKGNKNRDWMLQAPMPPARPITLSEELAKARFERRSAMMAASEIFERVRDYAVWWCENEGECENEGIMTLDEKGLKNDLREYIARYSVIDNSTNDMNVW